MQQLLLRLNWRTVVIDTLLIGAMLIVPALSHLLSIPLRMLDPMRWLLLATLLTSANNKANAYSMALLLPLCSCLFSGMPTPVSAVIIAAELLVNAWLYLKLVGKTGSFAAMMLAIVLSKAVYYALKALVLTPATIVGTQWKFQIIVALALSITASLFARTSTQQ